MFTGKYRKQNEPTNRICDQCLNKIWVRVSQFNFTQFNNQMYFSIVNNKDPESVLKLKGNKITYICYECYLAEGGGLEN